MKHLFSLFALWFSCNIALSHAGGTVVMPARMKDSVQLHSLLNGRSLVLIGETHGTDEIPAYIFALASMGVQSGYTVRLGLEMDEQQQQDIDRFMQTGDTAVLRQSALFAGQYDGRGSTAMARLLMSLRTLRDVTIYGFDRWVTSPGEESSYIDRSQFRDSLIASSIAEKFKSDHTPGKLHILLMGASHANSGQGAFESAAMSHYRGAALILKTTLGLERELLNLNTCYGSGSAWNCQDKGCQTYPVQVQPVQGASTAEPFIFLTGKDEPYCGYIYFPAVTASPPYATAGR